MNEPPGSPHRLLAPDKTEIAFRAWLRRLVSGAAELEAFDAGEIDAVLDRGSGRALLLPAAQNALHDANDLVHGTLDASPAETCVLDANGVVVMANKAWRVSGTAHARAGLDVRAGENILAACRDVPESERACANSVASGLRDVLNGMRRSSSVRYVCTATRGCDVFTLTMTAASAQAPVKVLLTREWRTEREPVGKTGARPPGKQHRIAPATRAGEENLLLAALPANEYARLASGLEPVTITYGQVLYEPGDRMRDVYFPSDCLVSLLTLVEGHRALEVGLVGREGMIGARLALGATQSSVRALVQGTGSAMRMNAERFLREFRRSQTLQRALLRFTDTLMVQISQTAACNRFHVVEARLARWLLMTAERMRSDTFHLTHGFLADMLGVRREGVTVAASALQRRGMIRYRRGNITIVDRQALEEACCSCYRHLHLMAADGDNSRAVSSSNF